MYVTRLDPINNANLYHTVVHIGCVAAKAQYTEQAAFNMIWEKFASRMIKNVIVFNGTVLEATTLRYYGLNSDVVALKQALHIESVGGTFLTPSQSPSIAREYLGYPFYDTGRTRGLLAMGDGICDAWADFMVNVLGVQGIQASITGIVPNQNINAFKINSNTPGQGTVSPKESIFRGHAVVQYNNSINDYIYDPSYGLYYGVKSGARKEFMIQGVVSVGTSVASSGGNTHGYGYVYASQMGPLNYSNAKVYFKWG